MTCQETCHLLPSYFDGELPARQMSEMEAHIQICPSCQKEADTLRRASTLLGSLDRARLTSDLAPVVVTRAASFTWRDRWVALWAMMAPRRRFFLRQVSRAAIIIVLFALAANVPGRGPSDLVISWPARVAGATVEGMAYLSAGIDRAQAFLSEIEFASTSRPVPSNDGEKSVLPDYEPSGAVQAALIWNTRR